MMRNKKDIIILVIAVLAIGVGIVVFLLTRIEDSIWDIGYVVSIQGDNATIYYEQDGKCNEKKYPNIDKGKKSYELLSDEYQTFIKLFNNEIAGDLFGYADYRYDIVIECDEDLIAINTDKSLGYHIYQKDDEVYTYEFELADKQLEFVEDISKD